MEYHNDITMKPSSVVYLIYTFKMQTSSSPRNKPRYLVKKWFVFPLFIIYKTKWKSWPPHKNALTKTSLPMALLNLCSNTKKAMWSVLLSPKEILWDDEKVYRINDGRTKKDRNEFMELYEAILHSLDSPIRSNNSSTPIPLMTLSNT